MSEVHNYELSLDNAIALLKQERLDDLCSEEVCTNDADAACIKYDPSYMVLDALLRTQAELAAAHHQLACARAEVVEQVIAFCNEKYGEPDDKAGIDAIRALATAPPTFQCVPVERLEAIDGCFEAAYVEGLCDFMENDSVTGNLPDLLRRRILPARDIVIELLAAAKGNR